MLDPVITTVIAVVAAPAIMATIQYAFQRGMKKQDWARQDVVAERVEQAARILKDTTAHTDATLVELKTGQKQIHTLVNSNLTSEMQSRKDSIERELVSLNELVSLKRKLRVKPNPRTLVAIKTAEASLAELELQLEDRIAATKKGEAEAREIRKNGDWVNGGSSARGSSATKPAISANASWIEGGSSNPVL
jgi:hypothetical protein